MDHELPGRAPAWYRPRVTIPESELRVDDGSRWKTGPSIAMCVVASLFGLVAFSTVLAIIRALGLQDDAVAQHEVTLMAPRPIASAAAAFAGYVAQAYLAGLYVRTALPKVGARWLRFSIAGALLAAAFAYWDGARTAAELREIVTGRVFDAPRLDTALLIGLAAAAAIGIAQAIALAPSGRRFLWWPFVAVMAAGALRVTPLALRSLVPHAIAVVLGTGAAGVVLGAGFVTLARPLAKK